MFRDNDFSKTLGSFLNLLKQSGIEITDKRQVVILFNNLAPGLYWLYQNRFAYDENWNASAYLRITENSVYFDDEVDAIIRDDNNCEFQAITL